MPVVFDEEYSKSVSEVRNMAFDYSDVLSSGEAFTGTITATATPSGPTIDNAVYSSTALTIKGKTVTAGQAITMRISGGTAGVRYEINMSGGTTSTPAQTIPGVAYISVQAD
jgi:hypothetical protein